MSVMSPSEDHGTASGGPEPPEEGPITLEELRVLERRRPLTVDDLERLEPPDEGRRFELVDGRLEVSPAAFFRHSDVAGRLVTHLNINCPPGFRIAPEVGVNLHGSKKNHRVVDVGVVELGDYPEKHVEEPLALAVEVLSPGTAIQDYNTKRESYARFGIPAYWIVDPDPEKPSLTEYRLDGDQYHETARAVGGAPFRTSVPFPITIVPYWLVAEDGDWLRRVGGE